jgi:hypothetical protein
MTAQVVTPQAPEARAQHAFGPFEQVDRKKLRAATGARTIKLSDR